MPVVKMKELHHSVSPTHPPVPRPHAGSLAFEHFLQAKSFSPMSPSSPRASPSLSKHSVEYSEEALAVVLFDYAATEEDELTMCRGEELLVTHRCVYRPCCADAECRHSFASRQCCIAHRYRDGWCVVTNERSLTGLVPANHLGAPLLPAVSLLFVPLCLYLHPGTSATSGSLWRSFLPSASLMTGF